MTTLVDELHSLKSDAGIATSKVWEKIVDMVDDIEEQDDKYARLHDAYEASEQDLKQKRKEFDSLLKRDTENLKRLIAEQAKVKRVGELADEFEEAGGEFGDIAAEWVYEELREAVK